MREKITGVAETARHQEHGQISSVADFAKYLGLSAWTVSRAINGHPEVSEKTRYRVRQAMDEIGFHPNPMARGMRGRDTGLIGVSVGGSASPILSTKIYHLQESLRAQHRRSLLEFSVRDPQNEIRVIEDFLRLRVDGIVLIYSALEAREAQRMLKGMACVQVDPHYPQTLPTVAVDRHRAMQLLLEHLLSLGHKRFALLGFNEEDPWRWPALVEYAEKRNLSPKRTFFPLGSAPPAEKALEAGRAMAIQAQQLASKPTAFIAMDDRIAIGAIQALKEAGVDVPGEISVTGFDNLDLARNLRPTLTTIEQNPIALMEQAAQLLFRQMAQPSRQGGKIELTVEPQLVIGESTGPVSRH